MMQVIISSLLILALSILLMWLTVKHLKLTIEYQAYQDKSNELIDIMENKLIETKKGN